MADEMMLDMVEVVVSITVESRTVIKIILISMMIVDSTEVTGKIRMSVVAMLQRIKDPQPVQLDGVVVQTILLRQVMQVGVVVQTILFLQVIVCGTNPLMCLKVQLCL